ncbi:MAG TPA: hypothetical protein VHC70_00065 [Phycisphaerales bacterium]|nr:hypothetical protein [Phycisphaerales bacterium]
MLIFSALAFGAPGCKSNLTDPASYEEAKALISQEVPSSEALCALPAHIPQDARDVRLYAEIHPGPAGDKLLLRCSLPREEVARIADDARAKSRGATGGRGDVDPTFYDIPALANVGLPKRSLLPKEYATILVYNLGGSTEGTTAGVIANVSRGLIVWWVFHRNAFYR